MTDPRITLPRAPGLLANRLLSRYLNFCKKFGSIEKVSGWDKHHIHPTKMGGGDFQDNWIWLPPRAHCIAHILLFKAFPNNQAAQRAAWLMTHTRTGDRISPRFYQFLKENYIFSEETRNKISLAGKNRQFDESTREKISASNRDAYLNTPSEVLLSRKMSMIEKKRGIKWSNHQRLSIVPSLPRGRDHWKLKNDPLWDRAEEIKNLWLKNGRCGHAKLCKLLGIAKTKKVLTIAKSVI